MARLLTTLEDFPQELSGGAVAVGNFDGVHRGHAALIAELVRQARRCQGPAIVLTFDPPPVAVLVPDRPPTRPLTSITRRAQLLGMLGVDALVAYQTDRKLLNLSAEAFFEQKIRGAMHACAMVEGPNFRFGKNRTGDTRLLRELCSAAGLELKILEPENAGGEMISSTRIRQLLEQGQVAQANEMLTQPYQIAGLVAKGAQRGRELGFPTANLAGLQCLAPAHGVYAGRLVLAGQTYPVAVNIGPNPTFGEHQAKVELHIVGWQGDLYGEHVSCELLKRLRDIKKFASVEALREQLNQDIARSTAVAAL